MDTNKVINTPPQNPDASGTIYLRRPRGKKYSFIGGGMTYNFAPKAVNWGYVERTGNLVFWGNEEGLFQVKKP
jgi:hypothetical protein